MNARTDGSRGRPRLATLCVVALLLVAGCGAATGPDDAGATTATNTTGATAVTADALPSGVTRDGVTNATRLLETHRQALVGTPGRTLTATNATLAGRTVQTETTTTATANLSRVRYDSRATGDLGNDQRSRRTVVYANATNVTQRVTADGEVRLSNVRARSETFELALTGFATASNPLRGLLSRGDYQITNVTRTGDSRVYTLRADSYVGGRLAAAENVTSYAATVRVTDTGVIVSARERIEGREAAAFGSYQFRYRFQPGAVTPEPVGDDARTQE